MTTVTNPEPAVQSWLPNLDTASFADLAGMDLGDAAAQLLARLDKPSSQLAGSSGS